jgi:hypothetical protein
MVKPTRIRAIASAALKCSRWNGRKVPKSGTFSFCSAVAGL